MTPAIAQESILLAPPHDGVKESLDHSSSYTSIMNGFGLWSTTPSDDLKKNTGSDVGTAEEDEEMGEEYVYEEPVASEEPTTQKKSKKLGGFLKKLKTRASRAKQERHERRIQKLESATPKSCIPTLPLLTSRKSYPVQITVLEGEDHNDYEIDELDEEEMAKETKTKAQGQRIKTLEWMTEQRIKDAMAHDDTESICSIDGIPILPPQENAKKSKKQTVVATKQRDLTKIQPQFVAATKDASALEAVRREVDALMMEQAVAAAESVAAAKAAVAQPAPMEEAQPAAAPVEEAPPTRQRSSGWSLFASPKAKEEPKEAEETKDVEKNEAVEEQEIPAPARPESKEESPKKSSGWSLFSWKSKDGNGAGKDDYDVEDGEDYQYDEEYDDGYSYDGSYDDDYTRGSPSLVSEDETRTTKITVVNTLKQ
jgi:hypothetical protein